LALCVNRVEGQRRFAGTAYPRHHRQLINGDRERDILEVIDARAPYFDSFLGHC
jgi:hypothetical protein